MNRSGKQPRGVLTKALFGVLIGLVLIAVCGLGVLLSAQRGMVEIGPEEQLEKTQFSRLQPGDCMVFAAKPDQNPAPEGPSEVAHLKVDCQSEGFKFKVASEGGDNLTCPSDWYWQYYSPKLFGDGVRRSLCLAPQFEKGACYVSDKLSVWKQTDCRSEHYLKVQKLASSAQECPRPDGAIELPLPEPSVVCAVSGRQ